jgi:hypothetical protein
VKQDIKMEKRKQEKYKGKEVISNILPQFPFPLLSVFRITVVITQIL